MDSVRLLLLSVLLATLIAAALVAALAGFAASSLPEAVSGDLATAPGTSVVVYGAFPSVQARIDQPVVPAMLRRAFGPVPFDLAEAHWSDPIGLPARRGQQNTPVVQAAAMAGIRSHAELTSGRWPASSAAGAPVQAAVPVTVARALHLSVGQTLTLPDRQSGKRVTFMLTGLYRPLATTAQYWGLDLIAPTGISVASGSVTYGPFIVPGSAFSSGQLAIDGVTWLATLRSTRIGAGELQPLATRVAHVTHYLTSSTHLGGLQLTSGLTSVLTAIATKLVVARSLLLVSGLELLLLAGAALALTVRTLAVHRESESALLTARGARRSQLARFALVEALAVTTVAAVAGGVAGTWLAHLLARSGSLRAAGLTVHGIPGAVWWTVAVVVVVAATILVWPALHPVDPGSARVRQGRQAVALAAAKAGGDLGLVALAVLAGWQLRDYSVLGRNSAGIGIDPVLALAPAVILAAATVLPLRLLPLRLLPLAARAADRLAARTRRLGAALPSWEISRRAARQSASMLLVVLATGTGTLALAQHQSWRRSAFDQAAFAAGADVRVDLAAPLPLGRATALGAKHSVTAAMPVATGIAATNGTVLALDPAAASRTVLLPPGQSGLTGAALFRRLLPPGGSRSVPLPGRPARLELVASLAPGPGPGLLPADVTVSIQDGAGIVYSVRAGALPADGKPHSLVVTLTRKNQAIYPLRLLGVTVAYTLPRPPPVSKLNAATSRTTAFTVRALAVWPRPDGPVGRPFASGAAVARWLPGISAAGLALSASGVPPALAAPAGGGAAGIIRFHPGFGETTQGTAQHVVHEPIAGQLTLAAPVPYRAVPGIATKAFLAASQLKVGDSLQVAAGPATIDVRIVSAISTFPTVTGGGGGLLLDEAAVADLLAEQGAPPLQVTQWWLSTRSGAPPGGLPPKTTVTDRGQLYAALLAEPMSGIAQQAVQAVTIAAALLAVLGFTVAIAGSVRERRSQSALMAALGVGASAQARLLCAEALALGVPAAVTGLLLGAGIARLLIPAVTLTPSGAVPIPAPLVVVPLGQTALLALIITAIPVAAAAASAAYRPDPAAQLRASEAT